MPEFYVLDELDSDDEDYFMETSNDNYVSKGRYVIDINYNRPLKHFPVTLNKIEEVDETSIKSPETNRTKDVNGNELSASVLKGEQDKKNEYTVWKQKKEVTTNKSEKQRPKSANAVEEKQVKEEKKRPRSSCARFPSKIPVKKKEPVNKARYDSDCSSGLSVEETSSGGEKKPRRRSQEFDDFYHHEQEFVSFHEDYPLRPRSACYMRKDDVPHKRTHTAKRSNSQPNITREPSPQPPTEWLEVSRFRRSLRLLGLTCSDFGLPDSAKKEAHPERPRSSSGVAPTFCTKILRRSISLECLKEVVREAASEMSSTSPYRGLPQRRLLAQAAYEEWYFKKCKQINRKMEEEREKSEKAKEMMEIENMKRKEKAHEQYMKWVERKKSQTKQQPRLNPKLESRLNKSREEIDKAYLQWKKKKQKDFDAKKSLAEKAEAEKAMKEEKQKQSEKAFNEWKTKLKETEKIRKERETAAEERLRKQLAKRSKPSKSFQEWKQQKDGQIKERETRQKEAAKQALSQRTMALSEREYIAEQAFEEWLEKVDGRRHTGGHL